MAAPPRLPVLLSPRTIRVQRQSALLLHPTALDCVSALVVCRGPARLTYVESTLKKLGYSTKGVSDEMAALNALEAAGFDVIVVDAELLVETVAAVGCVDGRDGTPIVALGPPIVSSRGPVDDGAMAHVGVPVDRGELAWALDRALMDSHGATDPVPTSRLRMLCR